MRDRVFFAVYLVAIPAMMVAIAIFGLVRTNRLAEEGRQAKGAICTFKADLERRVRVSERFLRDHPAGVLGIPAETLVTNLNNQKQTIRALRIDCGEETG